MPSRHALYILLGLAGCSTPDNPDATDLEAARATFASHVQSSYGFTWRMSCFCSSNTLRPTRIVVTGGAIASATFVDDQRPVGEPERSGLRTIEGVFDLIEQAIADGVDELTVTYDDQYAYPRLVVIDPARDGHDDETSLQLSGFDPAAAP